MFERRLWRNLDYYFVGGVIALLAIGLVVLNSASANVMPDPYYFVKKQLIWILFGLVGLVAVLSIDYEQLKHYHLPLYVLNIIMLAAVALVGHEAKGAQRWINLGFFLLQPSEFAKTITVITLACFLDKRQGKLNCWQDLVVPFLYVAVPLVLILKQPDLGTALVLLAILFGMLYVSGANWKLLLMIFGGGLLLTGLALFAHFHFGLPLPLQDYQMRRLVVFLNPYNDGKGGTGEGYHVIQSQIAIGSGGWWGVGLHQGSQVQLNFLPEAHTDFIFSVVGEELGFVRTVGIIALYFLVLYRMIRIAGQAKDMFGALLVGGVASMFAFHILVNVGITTGIMPVTGIPLPLFSYGGSAMLANMLALGLVLNVNLRRQKILF
ncbi:rod shape-determining protein RodA [Neomoorella thermoacetica]|uniref:Peptidoglycan glycosyltransferase RodA n=1 Tax=Moorella thermoacetica (strain ATCC 39073 / JCM 9320) TaxID=264732 RepID=Q2RL15_MOOTA|nr:rod shape-determining protein RodA [Moorella thermoacetica]AKX93297.1 Rod shape-determining protein RodA [Moorella thermoacetica]OIQ56025.1 Rod shape-determining protein RodA [Moorella thermoacetica]QCZ99750.1 Rod shape-determining protein RodA [Moorella thermoacetica]TYL08208.1 Peptidoglycan glycosyltransferase MrdB [Moorella thermoacetica]TYL15167.1 Peptidoglycan glycosyltransferase MrdB [Moorella thermoacetica]